MSDLERIKREREERYKVRPYIGSESEYDATVCDEQLTQAEAAVDQLIAMVQKAERALVDCWSSHQAQKEELDRARADVKKLRDAASHLPEGCYSPAIERALAETDGEEYR